VAGLAPVSALGSATGRRGGGVVHWRGSALGAEADLLLSDADGRAGAAIDATLAEIDRLEGILSLYRPDSALSRLNRDGRLEAPPLELVEVLSHAAAVSALSAGTFDVTVQPLWEALTALPAPDAIAAARALVDWRGVEATPAAIRLRRPGMKVTLNGIAQGYVTDRVAMLLRRHGHDRVLIDLGEARALGRHPSGRPWRVAAAAGTAALPLSDGALATSAPGDLPHLIDPASGRAGGLWASVTVAAAGAMQADALSTALALLPLDAARPVFARSGAAQAWLRDATGRVVTLRS
jgi:thiamine biosynthesis lipoprotein